MSPQAGPTAAGEPVSAPAKRDATNEYHRLLGALASKARRLGSRDPEGVAQEALKRSLENEVARAAVEFYFAETPPAVENTPEWPLDRLFAWLYVTLQFVVREEKSRAGFHREMTGAAAAGEPHEDIRRDPADPSPDQLDALIRKELHGIVRECFPALDREYRSVLTMRVHGLKYRDIALRLGVSENTVATWVSRGIRDLAQRVRRRTGDTAR